MTLHPTSIENYTVVGFVVESSHDLHTSYSMRESILERNPGLVTAVGNRLAESTR